MCSRLQTTMLLLLTGLLMTTAASAKEYRFEDSREYPVQAGFKLTVTNTSGNLAITKTSGDKVIVHITKILDASSREEAEEREDLIEVDIDAADNRIDIDTRDRKSVV